MSETLNPGVSVYICHQCIPAGTRLPRQWTQDGVRPSDSAVDPSDRVHVRVKELPCSGKTDAQYLFHAIEGGARGVLVVTCPQGECRLAQGNYRAEVRVRTVRRLLAEIGMDPERAVLIHCGPADDVECLVREAVVKFCALGESPIMSG